MNSRIRVFSIVAHDESELEEVINEGLKERSIDPSRFKSCNPVGEVTRDNDGSVQRWVVFYFDDDYQGK